MALVVVTGDKAIDAKLRLLPDRTQKKLVRGALRKGGKVVLTTFRRIVQQEAYNTGAYYKSAGVRALKRSRGKLGVTIHIDRDKYFQRYETNYGHKPNPRALEADPMYVPAAIEFGYMRADGTQVEAKRPQRKALYDNEPIIMDYFKQDMREVLLLASAKL